MSTIFRMLGGMAAGAGTFNLWRRASDTVTGDDPFSKHSRLQLEKHRFSGMHEPYVADFSTKERHFFEIHFPSFRHLLPFSAQDLAEQVQLKSPVRLRHFGTTIQGLVTACQQPLLSSFPAPFNKKIYIARNVPIP